MVAKIFTYVTFGISILPIIHGYAVEKVSLQQDAKIFSVKCAKCHTIQSALSSNDVTPSELEALINSMSQIEGANISSAEQARILDFMIYYMAANKKAALKEALNNLSSGQRETEITKIKQVIQKYK